MRICLISPSYFPTSGGTEVAIYELGKRLVNKGCEATLVLPFSSDTIGYEDDSGMDICRLYIPVEPLLTNPGHLYGRLFPPPITQMRILKKIMDLNKEKKFDVLHQFHVFYLGAACICAKKMLKKPLITSLMGWDTYDPVHPLSKFLNPYLSYVMNCSDVVVSPAKCTLKYVRQQMCKKKIKIIPHGVDTERFNPNIDGTIYRKKLKAKKDEIIILSVQRLAPRKAIEYLIYAIPNVVRENSNIKFVIIGDGPEKAKLMELARKLKITNNISFLGFVDSEELPGYYSACDIFVLHTLYEQFGIVSVEAMACGKAVISTEVGAVSEVVDNGKTGLLVECKQPRQLGDAILKLAGDENLRKKMGEEGRKKVEKEYDWNVIAEKYLQEYIKMTKSGLIES